MSIDELKAILQWSAVLNLATLAVMAVIVIIARKTIVDIHGKLFNLDEKEINKALYYFLAIYKIIIFAFFVMPLIAIYIASK